jgi:hypothetical protein
MHTDVSTIHESSQKKLKGRPKTIGKTRSQAGTEKHIAKYGINPSKMVPREGLLTWKPPDKCGRARLFRQIRAALSHKAPTPVTQTSIYVVSFVDFVLTRAQKHTD